MKTGRRVTVRVGDVAAEAVVLQGKCHEQRASGNRKEQGIHPPWASRRNTALRAL